MRLGSVFIDLLTVALAAWAARRWAGRDAAVLAALLLAVVPLQWAYAREIRAYVAVPLLTLAILALTDRLLRPAGRAAWATWAGLALAELALLYVHNLSVPVVAWLNLVVGAVWVYRRQWRLIGLWAALQAAALAAYLPWLLHMSPSGTALIAAASGAAAGLGRLAGLFRAGSRADRRGQRAGDRDRAAGRAGAALPGGGGDPGPAPARPPCRVAGGPVARFFDDPAPGSAHRLSPALLHRRRPGDGAGDRAGRREPATRARPAADRFLGHGRAVLGGGGGQPAGAARRAGLPARRLSRGSGVLRDAAA